MAMAKDKTCRMDAAHKINLGKLTINVVEIREKTLRQQKRIVSVTVILCNEI